MMFERLKGKMVTLYSMDLSDEYITGFILKCNEEELVFANVDSHGNNDGFVWLSMNGIYRIDYDSNYEKKLLHLYELNNQAHEKIECESNNMSLLESLLLWSKEHDKMVVIRVFARLCSCKYGKTCCVGTAFIYRLFQNLEPIHFCRITARNCSYTPIFTFCYHFCRNCRV